LLKFEKVICIIQNYNHHFIFDFVQLYLSVIVKFSDLIKLVSKNVLIFDTIKVNVKVKLKCPPLYEVSDTLQNKWCTANTNRTINYVYVLTQIFNTLHELINFALSALNTVLDFLMSFKQLRSSNIVNLFIHLFACISRYIK